MKAAQRQGSRDPGSHSLTGTTVIRASGTSITRTATRIWTHPANRVLRARRLATWEGWQVWERTVRQPVGDKPPGIPLHLRTPRPCDLRRLVLLPVRQARDVPRAGLPAGDVMLDVWANVGLYSLLAASVDSVRAIAFEPDDGARWTAKRNIGRNGFGRRSALRLLGRPPAPGPPAWAADRSTAYSRTEAAIPPFGEVRIVELVALDDVVPGPGACVGSRLISAMLGHWPHMMVAGP